MEWVGLPVYSIFVSCKLKKAALSMEEHVMLGPDSLDCLGKSIAQHLESMGLMGSVSLSLGEKATSCAHSYSGDNPSYSEHGIPLLGHFVKLLGHFRAILLLCVVLERAIREMEAFDNVG